MPVRVVTQTGQCLGMTHFQYVDEMHDMARQLVHDPAKQALWFAILLEEYGFFGFDSDLAQVLDPLDMQCQGKNVRFYCVHYQCCYLQQCLQFEDKQPTLSTVVFVHAVLNNCQLVTVGELRQYDLPVLNRVIIFLKCVGHLVSYGDSASGPIDRTDEKLIHKQMIPK